MEIGLVPSQGIISSASFSLPDKATRIPRPQPSAESVDRLELSNQIDPGFAATVLQDALAKRLESALQDAGIEVPVEQFVSRGADMSPQATSQRIVEFATGFFDQHAAANAELAVEDRIAAFSTVVTEAVEAGFSDAGDILATLGDLEPEIQANIAETFERVSQGLEDFARQQQQEAIRVAAEEGSGASAL